MTSLKDLNKKEAELYASFYNMPNTSERERIFKEWLDVRQQQHFILYSKETKPSE